MSDGDDVGLHVDMLDVDRLREWARLLLVHGPDIGHWASVPFVAGKMQILATELEKTIKDIGTLRGQRERLMEAGKMAIERGEEEGWLEYNGTDVSRLAALEDAINRIEGKP